MGHSDSGDITSKYIGQIYKLYKTNVKNCSVLSFIKDKINIFAEISIYKRYESNCKTKLS